jgi:acetolactate synthase-1/2/3 large subunit
MLDEFLSYPGPAFLEAIIDPEAGVYPMVGPGLSYKDMVTGDFIPNRYETDEAAEPDASELF